jgi:hypothetical protein
VVYFEVVMSVVLGRLDGKGVLIKKKEQRKKGRAKNVYIISLASNISRLHYQEISEIFVKMDGKRYSRGMDSFIFTKISIAEKAWMWFILRWS